MPNDFLLQGAAARRTVGCSTAAVAHGLIWVFVLTGPGHICRGDAPEGTDSGSAGSAVYAQEEANALLDVMFPTSVIAWNVSRVLEDPSRLDAWKDLDDTYDHHDEVQEASGLRAVEITFPAAPMESYWLSAADDDDRMRDFLDSITLIRLSNILRDLERQPVRTGSVSEKALLQRDLFHVYTVVAAAEELAEKYRNGEKRAMTAELRQRTAAVLRRLLLSDSELAELKADYANRSQLTEFTSEPTFRLEDDYLPQRAVTEDESWMRLNFHAKYNEHYNKYRGRSFIQVYARAPGVSRSQFRDYWSNLARTYGRSLNVSGGVPAMLPRAEFLLVRTMAVMLDDGRMANSGIVEEILIRQFAKSAPEFDSRTSDLRGTLHYQYLLDRRRLLSNPESAGLIRVHDNDPSYIGFYPRAPDTANSWNEFVNVSRFNCINCHSEFSIGSSSVFSFGYEEVRDADHLFDGHAFAQWVKGDEGGSVRLSTSEYLGFTATLTGTADR